MVWHLFLNIRNKFTKSFRTKIPNNYTKSFRPKIPNNFTKSFEPKIPYRCTKSLRRKCLVTSQNPLYTCNTYIYIVLCVSCELFRINFSHGSSFCRKQTNRDDASTSPRMKYINRINCPRLGKFRRQAMTK